MWWPTITQVARELRLVSENTQGAVAVVLIVYRPPEEGWSIRTDDAERDLGFAGSGTVPGCGGRNMMPRRFNARELARDLIWQAEQEYELGRPASRGRKTPPGRPFFLQAGTDDYAPEMQRFTPQLLTNRYLNGLGESGDQLFDGEGFVAIDGVGYQFEFRGRPVRRVKRTKHKNTSFFAYEVFIEEENRWMQVAGNEAPRPATSAPAIGNKFLNGFGAHEPDNRPHGCPRCHVDLPRGQSCPYCARDGVFVLSDARTWEAGPSWEYAPRAGHLPTRWEADVMNVPRTPPPAPRAYSTDSPVRAPRPRMPRPRRRR